MAKVGKKVLVSIGILIPACIGIVLLVFFGLSIIGNSPDSHFEGYATDAEIEKFDEYYGDFDLIATFVVQRCKEYDSGIQRESGSTYSVDVDNGYVLYFSVDQSSKDYHKEVPFDSDESVKQSIKRLKLFYGTSESININVTNDTVRFMHYGERVIHSPDNSVPTYAYHPREIVSSYSVYRFRENWYLAKYTTPITYDQNA